MGVFKVIKNKNFTTMSNYHLQDKDLSYKAKGMLSVMLSLPEDWDYSILGLSSLSTDGKDSCATALDELIKKGYVLRVRKRTKDGKIAGYEYHIYEAPPYAGNPYTDKPNTENQPQLNTNKQNTEYKKENNIKDIAKETTKKPNKYFENDELEELFIDFLAMRTKKKAPNTERAIKMLLNKLNKYDDKTKVVAINESILHGWVSVFPESADRFNQQNICGNTRQAYVQPAQTPVQSDRTLDVKSYTRGEILSVLEQDEQYRKLRVEYSRQSMELAKAQLNNADSVTLEMCEEKASNALETLNARIRKLGFDPREVQ